LKHVAGKAADKQGGALKKDGAVGKEFTKEGAVGMELMEMLVSCISSF